MEVALQYLTLWGCLPRQMAQAVRGLSFWLGLSWARRGDADLARLLRPRLGDSERFFGRFDERRRLLRRGAGEGDLDEDRPRPCRDEDLGLMTARLVLW